MSSVQSVLKAPTNSLKGTGCGSHCGLTANLCVSMHLFLKTKRCNFALDTIGSYGKGLSHHLLTTDAHMLKGEHTCTALAGWAVTELWSKRK